ncbi:uncharacterized protein ATC70_000723 [Mucor velutinosus]|uniref:Arginyl-tRNA--protein transferase 1 n=2 Tax=Mucor velutinosus TaxID=708070 RepID=A0AAN7I1K2_9FUNG|nr:hypothetical protein ATC70_008130 [Mucor velutinosus]KAK4517161.1 Arginyl-tRNA--protein transferase 1 [Mucor velutinosus]KAK4517388.1 hypothetical protein ATC70_000723 [Mucor velutinosus]
MRELKERQKKSDEIQQQMQKVFDNIVTGKQQLQLSFRMDQGNRAVATTGAVAKTSALPRSEDVSQSKQFSEESQQSPPPPGYNNTAVATISLTYNQEGVPLYKMSRQVTTVCDLWDEWTIGRDGFWSVQELEDKWGAKWRKDDRKWFNIRKKIIDSVEDLQLDLGLSPTSAVGALQKVLNTRHWSLDRLGTELQKGAFFPYEETKRRKLQHF